MRRTLFSALALLIAAVASATAQQPAPEADVIAQALRAGPESVAQGATVMDWSGNVLRQGNNGWVCYPDMPGTTDNSMCLDATWQVWLDAYMNKTPVRIDRVGIAYMLAGDAGASNTDPFATGPTADNAWVESGPHLMIITPDPAALDQLPTDPHTGAPWVMWKGTPYAHIMVPVPDPRQ